MNESQSKAINAAVQDILDMTTEEFQKFSKDAEDAMRESVISGKESLALTLWYAQDYEACSAWIEQVKKEAGIE